MKDVILTSLVENEQSLLTLNSAKGLAQAKLQGFAQSQHFEKDIALAIGQGRNTDKFRSIWLTGKISFPAIEIRAKSELGGAYGAFSQDTGKIYLSQELINCNSTNLVSSVLLEEYGHYIDTQLNTTDSPGDEGAIFSAVVLGKALEPEQLQQLKAKDDRATINHDGQIIQIEKASVSDSGGQRSTPSIYPLKLEADLNILDFSWQNYSIPDEFAVFYDGKRLTTPDQRIIGNVGLESGGESNKQTVVAKNGSDQVEVKITSPNAGTAWDFSVTSKPLEITVNGLLGDVIKVDISEEIKKLNVTLRDLGLDPNGFGLKSTDSRDNGVTRGSVAINVEDYNSDLQKGIFYFVPKVKGDPLEFGTTRNDLGIGQSTLTLTNGNIGIPINFNITDGFSTSGDNKVTIETNKLDIYRQQQRLAYLGFPGSSGSPLVVDGQTGSNTKWAIRLFNSVVSSSRKLLNENTLDKDNAKQFINATNAPRWNELESTSITRVGTVQNAPIEVWGANWTYDLLRSLVPSNPNINFNVNATSIKRGGHTTGHSGHEAGVDLDIDSAGLGDPTYAPNNMFYKENKFGTQTWYVEAPGGQVVIRNAGGKYESAAPIPANLSKAITGQSIFNSTVISQLFSDSNNNGQADQNEWLISDNPNAIFRNTNGSPTKGYVLQDVRSLITSFLNANVGGVTVTKVRFNDPRTWDIDPTKVVFTSSHNGHVHFDIKAPSVSSNSNLRVNSLSFASQNFDLESTDALSLNTATISNSAANSSVIELGRIEGGISLTGSVNTTNPETKYRFTLGNPVNEGEIEDIYFSTKRDFSLLLNQFSGDVDIELIKDFNGDEISQDEDIIAISNQTGNNPETLNLNDLDEGVYYLRVFQKSDDTSFNLSLTVPPLPVPTDNAGNTVTNAKNLGVLVNNAQQSDFIGQVDSDDYYRFTVSSTSDLNIDVTGLSNGDLFAELGRDKNKDGALNFDEVIASSDEEGDTSEKISFTGLAAGEYILHLGQNSGSTNYDLKLSAPPANIPTDKAGNTPSTAFDIGSLNTAANFSDFVGNVDPEDFYRFTLTNVSGLKIQLSGLSADADLELAQDTNNSGVIDSNEIINTSELQGTSDEEINLSALAAGTYFVRVHQYDGDTNYNLSLTPTTPVGSDLSVTRTEISGSVDLGQQYTYSLTVTNNGPDTAKNVVLTEDLPSNTKYISGMASNFSFANQQNGIATANLGTLENGKSVTVSFVLKTFAAGSLFGTTTVTSDASDYNPANNSLKSVKAVNSIVSPNADLSLTQKVDKLNPSVGDKVTFTLELTNKGPGTATSIQVLDLLLATLDFVSAAPTIGNYDHKTGVWTVGNIAPNNPVQLVIVATVNSAISITNTAEVIAVAENDPNSTPNNNNPNEDDQASITLNTALAIQPADLELSLTSDKTTVNIEDLVTFRLTLKNKGPGAVTSIQVKHVLPKGLTFVLSSPQQGSYDAVSGIWDVGNIVKDNQAFIDIVTKVTSGGSLFNAAEVIAVAEIDPDSTPSNNSPNEDDQASVTLNAALAIPSLTKIADDIFTISGGAAGQPKLQITISDSNLKSVNDFAVFTVDDAQGRINGIAPTEAGYTQAALSRAKNIFSAIANLPNGFDTTTLSRSLEFNSGDNLRFLLIKNDTLDNVRKINVSNPDILFSNANNQKITDSGTGNFTLAWKDGSGNNSDFKDFVVIIQSTDTPLPLGASLQDQQEGEVLDLRSVDSTKTVQANFVVNREAAYNNFVGFYKITDSQGTITDPLTGLSLKPGDSGYAEAAIKTRIAGIDLQAANQSTATINGVFQGGSIFAPFIVVNGSPDQLLDTNKSNDPAVYFAYLGANYDGIDHIRLLGNNTFGFEDLRGGGDLDYNDIIIRANLSVI